MSRGNRRLGAGSADEGALGARFTRAGFVRGAGAAAVVIGAGGLVQACGSSTDAGAGAGTAVGSGPPARATGELRAAFPTKPPSLDPARAIGVPAYTLNQNLYDGLTLWDEDPAELAPALATEWSSNDDATEWTFVLRPDVVFHDGEPLTSTAVRRTFEHYRDGEGSFLGSYAGEFAAIDDRDPAVVKIRYDKPFPDLARNAPILGIISPKALAGAPAEVSRRLEARSYGAGAFSFEGGFRGNEVTLDANTAYWGDGPHFERLRFQVVPDESARVAALQAGDVDLLLQVTPVPLKRLENNPAFTVATTTTWAQDRLIFACDRAPFTDARARQAVAHAVDAELLIDRINMGQALPGRGLMPRGCYGYTDPGVEYPLDPEKARALWQAAGGSEEPVTIAYFAGGSQIEARTSEAIADQLSSIGIPARVVPMTDTQGGDELHGRQRKYDVLVVNFGWINGGPFFYTPGVFSDTQSARYRGRDVLDLQERQNSTADGPRREQLLERLQRTAQEQLYVYAYDQTRSSDVHRRDIGGYRPATNAFMYRFADAYRA